MSNVLPPAQRTMITIALMSATVMQVLDTTIVNVALPDMQGELGASPDQISWVLTSYMVAAAVVMLFTGFLTNHFGRKRYLQFSVVGFVIASVLCGVATSLPEMVLFRLLQGISGAALVPLSQAIMSEIYPPEERGKAMALWGMGVMVGPIAGPTLGGYLTQTFDWRWTFLINLPVGILTSILVWRTVPDAPRNPPRRFNWQSAVLLTMGLSGLQFVLDRGNDSDWFAGNDIRIGTVVALVGFIGFGLRTVLSKETPLFDPAIFKDRNFIGASIAVSMLCLGLYGAMVLQPLMLEGLLGYPTMDTGMIMAPRGIANMFGMMWAGRLMAQRVDARLLVGAGFILAAIGNLVCMNYSLNTSKLWLMWPLLVQGLGAGLAMTPLSALALSTIAPRLTAEAAGLGSVIRTLGGGIGIALITTMYSRHTAFAWNQLGGGVTADNPAVNGYLSGAGMSATDPGAMSIIAQELDRQARMVSIDDVFLLIGVIFLAMLPLLILIKNNSNASKHVSVAE